MTLLESVVNKIKKLNTYVTQQGKSKNEKKQAHKSGQQLVPVLASCDSRKDVSCWIYESFNTGKLQT